MAKQKRADTSERYDKMRDILHRQGFNLLSRFDHEDRQSKPFRFETWIGKGGVTLAVQLIDDSIFLYEQATCGRTWEETEKYVASLVKTDGGER